MRVRAFVRLVLIGCCLTRLAAAQGAPSPSDDGDRGPRFYLAMAGAKTVVDGQQVPVLRRRVTTDLVDVPLPEVLRTIAAQAGLRLAYSPDVVPLDRRVSLQVRNITVAAALTEVLGDEQIDVVLSSGNQLGLARHVRSVTSGASAAGTIVGRVTEAKTHTPLAGATVMVEGTARSATSGNDGRFRVTEVVPGTYTVRARYIGYAPASASVTVTGDQEATADFALEKSVQQLDEVVTTGTVAPTQVKALPTPITVITADEIAQKNIQHVDQLFRGDVPGSFAWDLGVNGFQTQFASIRGSGDVTGFGTHYKVYIDGVEMALDDTFLANLDPSSIDRIEIVRGPQASTLYGAEALSGVMQIFTKKGIAGLARPQVEAKASAGLIESRFVDNAVAAQDYGLDLSGGAEHATYHLGGTYRKQGAYVPEYGSERGGLSGGARVVNGPVTLDFGARYVAATTGIAVNPVDPIPASHNITEYGPQQMYSTTVTYRATPRWQHVVVLGLDRDEYNYRSPQLNPGVTPSGYLNTSFANQLSVGYHTTLTTPLGDKVSAVWTGGLDHWVYHQGGDLVQPAATVDGNIVIPANAFVNIFQRNFQATGYYGQAQLGFEDAVFLTAGLRGDQSDNFGADVGSVWAPRVGIAAVRQLGGVSVKLRASYGKAIKAPPPGAAQPFVFPGLNRLASPGLLPEQQVGFDGGVELYLGNRASVQATYYSQTATNLVDTETLGVDALGNFTQRFFNLGRVRNTGWELEGSVTPFGTLTVTGSLSIANGTVDSLAPNYSGLYVVGDRLLQVPHTSAGFTLSYALPTTTFTFGGTYADSWVNYDLLRRNTDFFVDHVFTNPLRSYWITYPSITRLRAAVSQQLTRQVGAFVQVENLTNQQTGEQSNVNLTAGRTTVLGVRVRY